MVRKVGIGQPKQIQASVKQALIKNITFGILNCREFCLNVNESKVVNYTELVKNYAGKKLIKILKIY